MKTRLAAIAVAGALAWAPACSSTQGGGGPPGVPPIEAFEPAPSASDPPGSSTESPGSAEESPGPSEEDPGTAEARGCPPCGVELQCQEGKSTVIRYLVHSGEACVLTGSLLEPSAGVVLACDGTIELPSVQGAFGPQAAGTWYAASFGALDLCTGDVCVGCAVLALPPR
jgi:hypothetical protein